MKKTYTKPQMYFESFELTTSVSAGCIVLANYTDDEQCSVYDSDTGKWLFTDYCNSRTRTRSICYHVSSTDGVFTS